MYLFRITSLILFLCLLYNCQGQETSPNISEKKDTARQDAIHQFQSNHPPSSKPSVSLGTVSNGSLENGCFLPFEGENYRYFSERSYLMGRCFMHCDLKNVLIDAFTSLKLKCPERIFYLMEASNEKGGKIMPHRTHQNGTSIDLMIPLVKGGKQFNDLDTTDTGHYFLHFDNQGRYDKDTSVSIDYETLVLEILSIEENARKQGWKISKVIFKTELQPYLYETKYRSELSKTSIYFTKKLESVINELHDDHIHIDFEKITTQ